MVALVRLNIVKLSQNVSMCKSTTMLRECARIAIILRAVTRWLIDVNTMIESYMPEVSAKPAIYVTITVGLELPLRIRILKVVKQLIRSNLIIIIIHKLMLQALSRLDNKKFSNSIRLILLSLHLKIINKYKSWPRIMGNQPKKINKQMMSEINLPHLS